MNPIARKLFCTLLTFIAFVFFLDSAVQSAAGKCPICHNGHTQLIACDQVAKYLQNHPGDTNGPCPVVSQEKPQ